MVKLVERDTWDGDLQLEVSVMNPCDHPHRDAGEGRSPIGRPSPVTPWGKPALGYKTRKNKKASDKLIVRL